MYTFTDKREKKEVPIILFNDIEVGEFFYAQIFDGSCSEFEEQFCLKVDKENYFCFTTYCHLLNCEDYQVLITEVFNGNNKNKIKITVE